MSVPPLKNGMPRVDYDEKSPDGVRVNIIVTEDEPIGLLAADSGLELVFEPTSGAHGYPWSGTVRAVRRKAAPQVA